MLIEWAGMKPKSPDHLRVASCSDTTDGVLYCTVQDFHHNERRHCSAQPAQPAQSGKPAPIARLAFAKSGVQVPARRARHAEVVMALL